MSGELKPTEKVTGYNGSVLLQSEAQFVREERWLSCFCCWGLLWWRLLFFHFHALTEAVGLPNKFQNVTLAGESV